MRFDRRANAIHLVDLENLAGGAYPSPATAASAVRGYAEASAHQTGDLVFLAANRRLLTSIAFDLPFTCRAHTATGPDGADLALLAKAPAEWVCARFQRIVIGSGDHAFVPLAASAVEAGLDVSVIGRPGAVARSYFDLGCEIRLLGAPSVVALTARNRDHGLTPAAGHAA